MLLAIDTATRATGVCLANGAQILAEHIWHSERYHTVELAPEVAVLLQRNHVDLNDLEAVAVASGPGSYTGLRIGMALAKGIALAQRIPLIGVPTLDILAAAQPAADFALADTDRRRPRTVRGGMVQMGRSKVESRLRPRELGLGRIGFAS